MRLNKYIAVLFLCFNSFTEAGLFSGLFRSKEKEPLISAADFQDLNDQEKMAWFERLASEINTLKHENEKMEESNKTFKEEKTQLNDQITVLNKKIEDAKTELSTQKEKENENILLKHENEKMEESIKELIGENTVLNKNIEDAKTELSTQKEKEKIFYSEFYVLKDNYNNLFQKLEEPKKQDVSELKRNEELLIQLTETQQKLSEEQDQKKQIEINYQEILEKCNKLSDQISLKNSQSSNIFKPSKFDSKRVTVVLLSTLICACTIWVILANRTNNNNLDAFVDDQVQ